MNISYSALSDVGRKRDHNEDNYGVIPELDMYMVADGMGGHAAGEVASYIAVEVVKNMVQENADIIKKYKDGDASVSKYDIRQMLEQAVQSACLSIYNEALEDSSKRGMGTTVDVLLLLGERGFIAHVGDSRIYMQRMDKVLRLTADHSLMNELIRKGKYKSKNDFMESPYVDHQNALTRAVGVYETVEVETIDFQVLPGDKFLLCSDGLSEYLNDRIIEQTFQLGELEQVTRKFIEIANEGGGHDNITAVVASVPRAKDQSETVHRATEINLSMEVLRGIILFQYLKEPEIIKVFNMTEMRNYEPEQMIVKEGELGDEFFIVLRGTIRLEKNNKTITKLHDRDHFGEMALVDKAPRSASAIAESHTKVLTISRKDFYTIIRNEHGLAVKLLWSFLQELTKRLRKTTNDYKDALEAETLDADLISED